MAARPKFFARQIFRTLSAIVLFGIGATTFMGGVFLYHVTQGLPDVKALKDFRHAHATQVFAEDGTKIGEFSDERRYPVAFESIPKHVIQAFLAAEDAKFFEHKGIDFVGMGRALVSNILRGKYAQGASTITQQVARGLLLSTRKKELTRKVREIVLARRMEKELTKQEILALYLNDIFLGHGAYGIGAAAQNYFHKKVEALTVAEAALLAGLPQRPSEWDPFHGPSQAKKRQLYVLRRMVDENFVSAEEARAAAEEPLKLYALEDINQTAAPYVTMYVFKYLEERYGAERIYKQGFKVHTTVQYGAQKHAQRTMEAGVREVDKRIGWRGPEQRLAKEKIEAFQAETHEKVLESLTPLRILPPSLDAGMKKLQYDMTVFRGANSVFYGETPIKAGEYYSAVIVHVDDAGQRALGKIGFTDVQMPFASMQWAIAKTPSIKLPSQFLKVGDVVQVRVERINRVENSVEVALEQEPEVTGALLSYELNNGFVRSMVGGTNFRKSQFNIAVQGKRQVGSVFKPVIYAAAIDRGFSPASIVTDAPIVFKFEGQLDADNAGESWRPQNYSGKFEGDIPIRLALIRSMNIPTVKILNEVTLPYLIDYSRRLGITSPLQRDLSIALGSWSSSLEELTRIYAVFPRLGKPIALVYIKRIEDHEGKVIEEYSSVAANQVPPVNKVTNAEVSPEASPEPSSAMVDSGLLPELPEGLVISPQTAYVMTDMLRGVIREGTGTAAARVPAAVAGKTGTSNDHRDAWFIGYTPHLMTGIWIGYEKDKPLDPGETGGKAAAPIWASYMEDIVKNYPKGDFSIPDDIAFAYIDRETGKLASVGNQKRVRVAFRIGTIPNAEGDNLPRIGEPGQRVMTTEGDPLPVDMTDKNPNSASAIPKTGDETSDYLRKGYQD